MLQKLRLPVILVAQAHRSLSVRELKARRDAQPVSTFAHSALTGAHAVRAWAPARGISIALDNIFGTQRLNAHSFAMRGIMGELPMVPCPRLVAAQDEPTGDKESRETHKVLPGDDIARYSLPPEERLPYVPLIGAVVGCYRSLASLPRTLYITVDKIVHRKRGQAAKDKAAGPTLEKSWPGDKRTFQMPMRLKKLRAQAKELYAWHKMEEGSDAQKTLLDNLTPALLQQQRMLHLIGFTLNVVIVCALSVVPLVVKAAFAGVGALLGVGVGVARWAFQGGQKKPAALALTSGSASIYPSQTLTPLFAGYTLPTEQQLELAQRITPTTLSALEAHRKTFVDRLTVQPGDRPLLNQARQRLGLRFRHWLTLTPDEPDNRLAPKEREAVRYFFTSEEGFPPEVWSDWDSGTQRSRILELFFIQKFDQLHFLIEQSASSDPHAA